MRGARWVANPPTTSARWTCDHCDASGPAVLVDGPYGRMWTPSQSAVDHNALTGHGICLSFSVAETVTGD